MAWSRRLVPAMAALLARCDGTVSPAPTADLGAEVAPADAPGDGASAPEVFDDAAETGFDAGPDGADGGSQALDDGATTDLPELDADASDAVTVDVPDAANDAPDAVTTALDAAFDADDGSPPSKDGGSGDALLIEDLPVTPADVAALDAGPGPDAGPLCPVGLNDHCPATAPGPCPRLVPSTAQVVRFNGLTASIALSCEGSLTRNARDGVVPLVLTAPSDVTVTAQPSSGDVAVVALLRAEDCGLPSGELRCSNGNVPGATARASATSLEPGTYFVSVTALNGNPVTLTATVTPARPRRRGDVCPGVPITPDAAPMSLSTSGFQTTADYGTNCGAGGTTSNWVDAVFSYTLTAPRDVTLMVSANSGDVAVDVAPACGARMGSVPPCQSGSTVRRLFRNQQPGTWYVTVDHRAATSGRTITASVATATPTPTPPADRCPGLALVDGVASSVDVAQIGGDTLLGCVRNQRADGYFSFRAPPADRDVLLNVRGAGAEALGYTLQSPCGRANVGTCVGTTDRAPANLWARLRGLTPDADYAIAVGTAQTSGTITARVLSVPTATPAASMNANSSCARAAAIPSEGGIVTGSNASGDRVFSALCGVTACIGGRAMYHRLTLTQRRRVVINTLGSGFDTVVNVLSGDCPGRAVDGGCSDDAIGTAALVDVTLDAGSYVVMVGGCGATSQGAYTLDVAVLAP